MVENEEELDMVDKPPINLPKGVLLADTITTFLDFIYSVLVLTSTTNI